MLLRCSFLEINSSSPGWAFSVDTRRRRSESIIMAYGIWYGLCYNHNYRAGISNLRFTNQFSVELWWIIINLFHSIHDYHLGYSFGFWCVTWVTLSFLPISDVCFCYIVCLSTYWLRGDIGLHRLFFQIPHHDEFVLYIDTMDDFRRKRFTANLMDGSRFCL